jgi:hypothetical protein
MRTWSLLRLRLRACLGRPHRPLAGLLPALCRGLRAAFGLLLGRLT